MTCGQCGSSDLNVNGLFYTCLKCGNIDDSSLGQIMRCAVPINGGKNEGKE